MKLSPEEKILCEDITYKLSQPLTEISASELKDTLLNVKKNWRNWSLGVLTSLMMNPTNAQAIQTYLPKTYTEIQSTISWGDSKTIDFSQNFNSGQTSLNNSPELVKNIQDIKDYISGKKLSKYKIKIIASESQVPNQSPYKTPGSLAAARAAVIKNIVNKLGLDNVEIINQIGNTPYKSGDNPNDSKFKKDQFVKLEISINTKEICNFSDFSKGGTSGDASNDYITYEEDIDGIGNLELKTGSIPDRIVITDSKGNITNDSGYITTEDHKYSNYNLVPLYILELTKVRLSKNLSVSGSKIRTIKVSSFQELLNSLLVDPSQYKPDKLKETGLALSELKKLFDSGVHEFVLYDKVNNPYRMEFNSSKGDTTIKIFSPVSQTGFQIKGSCK